MQHTSILIFFIAIINLAAAQTGECAVEIKGFQNNNGKCTIYLFKEKKGFPTDFKYALSYATGTVVNGKCMVVLKNIPYGTYAIAAHHDENNNSKLDKNFIGLPKEGVGTSNNAKSSFGPPSFDDSKITINKSNVSISITIKNL